MILTILLYLRLVAISLCGMSLQLISKSADMEITCKKSGVEYRGFISFLKTDYRAVIVNLLTIVVTFLMFNDLITVAGVYFEGKTYRVFDLFDIPLKYIWNVFITIFFFSTGYFGQDFILRRVIKSVQNKMIKDEIESKYASTKNNDTPQTPTN